MTDFDYLLDGRQFESASDIAMLKKLSIKFDIHAYAEERLHDEYFDESHSWGIVGPEIMKPLSEKINSSMDFSYDEDTRIEDLIKAVKAHIWGNPNFAVEEFNTSFAFVVNGERLYPQTYQLNFSHLLYKYLDPNHCGEITLSILVSHDAGAVAFEYPLRFYVNSHEAGRHNEPHVHVRDNGYEYEASIRISDGKILAGTLPKKLARIAKKKILSEQNYFYKCWNTQTDGLYYDINKHYGIIKY